MNHFILGSRYYFIRLSEFEKKIYRQIYDAWVSGGNLANVHFPGTGFDLPTGRSLHDLIAFIIGDNPHLFHLETSQFTYTRHGTQVTIFAENVYTPEEYKRIYGMLISRVNQIVAKAKQYPTDYEKIRFLHDYLAENITYDMGAPDPRSQREIHTIVGALLNSACVCDGYARAFRLLCDQLHLSCIVAMGDSIQAGNGGPHAWNFVKLNGQVYHVDVTWDSNFIADGSPIHDHYFLRNDAVFSKDHAWDPAMYPPIKQDYPRSVPTIKTKWECEDFICKKINAGQRHIVIHLAEDFPGADFLNTLLTDIVKRNPTVFRNIRRYDSVYYDSMKYAEIRFE